MAGYKEGQRLVLLDLPDEVLAEIVEWLPTHHIKGNAVKAFRATCSEAFRVCDPLWWRHLSIHCLSKCSRIKEFLSRHPRRYLYVRFLEFGPDYRDLVETDSFLQELAEIASLCPNLEHLCIQQCNTLAILALRNQVMGWETELASQFGSFNFDKLRYCYATLWLLQPRLQRPLILPLLGAQRLIDLTLECSDLRQLGLDSIPMHSTALERLKLSMCRLDQPTLAAILGIPRSLATFEITPQVHHNYDRSTEVEGYRLLLQAVELLIRFQPNLISLGLTFRDGSRFESGVLNDSFDFSRLSSLKKLTIHATNTSAFRPYRQGLVADFLWCPMNALDKLPASLKDIFLVSETEDIDLDGLSEALLKQRTAGKSLPASLRLYCDVEMVHEQIFTEMEQPEEDTSPRAIDILMMQLSFVQVKYSKQWAVIDRDGRVPRVYNYLESLEANKTADGVSVKRSLEQS
ncbi:hypothetical protein Z517_11389 [Fonsecaea pedrosoi CBS 271.37]|uniref:F-box domain-containing protein n=1 Tax=Fonsecaea pedrosoi CBS 271.37 TaxID=1442368 RepID=A0A0D2GQD6_9EURO|nr:uncharacterized protein Z517_11389 [Fonsecaea pedrosoi CBS 271.37]KIW74619.1 hypothetical protein Z517_11389 [Fonsecaea pedrosoi CBS 271.37]